MDSDDVIVEDTLETCYNYILKTKGKYPVLHSTYEGLHYSESITEGKLKKLKIQLEGNKMPFDM